MSVVGRESQSFLREMLIVGTKLHKNLFYTEGAWAVISPGSHSFEIIDHQSWALS